MRLDSKGYITRYISGRGSILEHRYIMEMHLGRRLNDSEVVHHINHNKLDNRIENLQLMTKREHTAHHNIGNKFSSKYIGDRICSVCNSNKTYTRPNGYYKWYYNNDKLLCSICYNRNYNRTSR